MAENGKITAQETIEAKKIVADFNAVNESALKILKTFGEIQKLGSVVKTRTQGTKLIDKANEAESKGLAIIKERQRLERSLQSSIAKKNQALSATNKELIKNRTEANLLNRTVKDEVVLTSKLTGEYKKLAVQHKRAAETLRDYIVEGKRASETQKQFNKRIDEAQREFNQYDAKIKKADTATKAFGRNVGNYPKTFAPAISAVRNLIGAFGIASGVTIFADLIKDSLALAREAKGVEFAFNRLGISGVKAFEEVRSSTRGLLSDLDIKRSLVEFDNFNISLDQSATLFEFLAVRAAQTGVSVDKLKQSLVEGLSKESKLRIDNLGISAAQLNEQLEKTPNFVEAVAIIAKSEIAEAGDILDKAANSQERFNTSLENAKVAFGQLLESDGFSFFGFLARQIDNVTQGFKALKAGLIVVRNGFNDVIKPITDLVEKVPFLSRAFDTVSNVAGTFFRALSVSGLTVFSNLIIKLGATLSGLGAAFGAAKDGAIDFARTLARIGEIELSLNPAENLKNFATFFKEAKDSFTKGGANAADAFNKAYEDALNISSTTNNSGAGGVDVSGGGGGEPEAPKALRGTVKFLEELIKQTEEERDSRALTNEEYTEYEKIIDRIREKIKDIKISGDDISAESVLGTSGIVGGDNSITAPGINTEKLLKDSEIDAFEASELEKTRIQKEQAEIRKGILTSTLQAAQDIYGVDLQLFIENIQNKEATFADYAEASRETLLSLNEALLDGTLNRLDEERDANRSQLERVLNDEFASEEKKKAAQKKFDKQEAEIKRQQFEANKKAAIAQNIINTAVAITQAYAQLGPIGGTIAGVLITALSLVQLANIKKQRPPQFFKGKDEANNYEGLATWNEHRPEVNVDRDGNVVFGRRKNELRYVSAEDIIHKSVPDFQRAVQDPSTTTYQRVQKSLVKEHDQRTNMVVVQQVAGNDFDNEGFRKMFREEMRIYSNRPNKVIIEDKRKSFGY